MINVTYQRVVSGEAGLVCDLAVREFDESIKPVTCPEGVLAFKKFANSDDFSKRLSEGNSFALTAKIRQTRNDKNPKIAGIIEIRDHSHVNMIFVDNQHQNKGISTSLMEIAIEQCKIKNKNPTFDLTVAATPNSVSFFEKLGFSVQNVYDREFKHVNGLDFIPMKLTVQRKKSSRT